MQAFDYIFNVGGNFTANIQGMTEATGDFSAKVEGAQSWLTNLHQKLAVFDLATGYVEKLSAAFEGLGQSGVTLDRQLHDLSAVAGVTGDGLKEIEGYARASAKAFGTDAGVAVEGYKLLLSQLTPELAKCPAALSAMGDQIQITSKLMGGDGVAAAQVLTTAMNQYGVSMKDPIEASKVMAEMMNTMAAAGQAGSAELPAISAALSQCGMAAKAANVSFEETNAAIQVLDKAGKKASEGGVALRNTLSILSQGRFLPKDTKEELEAAGIDVLALGDKNKTLKERLEMLKPVLNDSALLSKVFGMENANAARALIQGTEKLGEFTEAVTGTKSAEEQAAIVMDSYAEKQARINQQIEDVKISVFEATNGVTGYISAVSSALVPLAQFVPLISGVGSAMVWIKNLQWASMWSGIQHSLRNAALNMYLMTDATMMNNATSLGFIGNMSRATLTLLRFGTVGVFNALKGLGALLLSFVTTGGASASFASIASASFATFSTSATAACRAVSIAIVNIPIVGWIAAGIAGLAALSAYFWNTSATFRAVLKGIWAGFKATFTSIAGLGKDVFGSIGALLTACFNLDAKGISSALDKLKTGFSNYGREIGGAFSKAYNEEIKGSETQQKQPASGATGAPVTPSIPSIKAPTANAVDPTSGKTGSKGMSSGSGDSKIKNITVKVDKLVEKFEVHTTNLQEGSDKIREQVIMALMAALNDVNLAAG